MSYKAQVAAYIDDCPPGRIRVFRVESRDGSAPRGVQRYRWSDLPSPVLDIQASLDLPYDEADLLLDALRARWGDWHCATSAETVSTWWPQASLDAAKDLPDWLGEPCYSILELEPGDAIWCGTQYIINRKAAIVVARL